MFGEGIGAFRLKKADDPAEIKEEPANLVEVTKQSSKIDNSATKSEDTFNELSMKRIESAPASAPTRKKYI